MRNTISKNHIIIACALALVFFLCAPAAAQSQDTGQQQQQMQQMQQKETPDFSDARIEKTAEAYTEITKIREQYQDEFSQAEDSEQAQELQTRINKKITDAIEQNDISVEDYNEVITAAQTDEDLRAELLDRIRELRK
jgi:flagellar biosynthesis protein FliP